MIECLSLRAWLSGLHDFPFIDFFEARHPSRSRTPLPKVFASTLPAFSEKEASLQPDRVSLHLSFPPYSSLPSSPFYSFRFHSNNYSCNLPGGRGKGTLGPLMPTLPLKLTLRPPSSKFQLCEAAFPRVFIGFPMMMV